MFSPEAPLIIHDGELADICQLLAELGLAFVEAPARVADVAEYYSASLVISSPQFLLERLDGREEKHPPRIAVMTSEARTLRSLLARSGVVQVVRRPVHPTALRLFILHCLYRGHDKRRNERVSIGTEVQVKGGWRRRKMLLAEISQRDCRLVSKQIYKLDQKVSLRLPPSVTNEKPLSLSGRVVRIGAIDSKTGLRDVCLIFEHLNPRDARSLGRVIGTHQSGPAIYGGNLAAPQANAMPPSAAPIADPASAATEANPQDTPSHEEPEAANRRATPRHSFERRVIALGDEAARVLLGRDISLRGMRVDPSPALALGDKLQIAIHAPGQKTPLVLCALVKRDDGERGLHLDFVDTPADAENHLRAMLEPLPALAESPDASQTDNESSDESTEESTEESPLIVSEILEHDSAG